METDFNALVPSIDKAAVNMPEAEARAFLTKFSLISKIIKFFK